MKCRQFTTIEEVRQAQLIVNTGVQVAERKEGHYLLKLYQVRSGYIEVFLHEHFNVIIKAIHFHDLLHLDPYLGTIDISPAIDYRP